MYNVIHLCMYILQLNYTPNLSLYFYIILPHYYIRAAMARPSSLSIIPVPHHQFPGLAVTQKDFRLNFCVNTGSKSMPSVVPIYSPQCLDELLDEVSA